jgi:hypothetical protein
MSARENHDVATRVTATAMRQMKRATQQRKHADETEGVEQEAHLRTAEILEQSARMLEHSEQIMHQTADRIARRPETH